MFLHGLFGDIEMDVITDENISTNLRCLGICQFPPKTGKLKGVILIVIGFPERIWQHLQSV